MRFKILSRGGYSNGGVSEKGGTMTAALFLHADPVEPLEAATKQYADNALNNLNASNFIDGILPISSLPEISGDVINTLGSNNFNLTTTGVSAGTYPKVGVDIKGRITNGFNLAQSDIPNLDWSKINAGKPTTAAGYGITDALGPNGGVINGPLISNTTPTDNAHIVTKGYVDTIVSNIGTLVSLLPGDLIRSGTTTTPSGYLRCNGGQVSKTTYSSLYSVIGDKYSTYNLVGNGKPWKQQFDINTVQTNDLNTWNNINYSIKTNLGTWTTGTSLPGALYGSSAIVTTGTTNRVYLLGGDNGSGSAATATVYTAPINADGTLGAWTTGTSLPGALQSSSAIVTTGTTKRVYLLGGYNGSAVTATVYTATINADGTLGAWTTGTSLPGALFGSSAIVTTGTTKRVYLLGGYNGSGSGTTATVYTAPINADGTLGTWTTGTSLPGPLYYSSAIVTTGTTNRVYLLGGGGSAATATVYTAPINADGTLGAWTTGTSLPGALQNSSAIVTTGTTKRVYLLGGSNGSPVATVYTAIINADGTLGTWTTGTSLPGALYGSSAIVTTGTTKRVYLLGGYNGTIGIDNIYISKVDADGAISGSFNYSNSTIMNLSLYGSQCFVTNNKIYQIGGFDGTSYTSNIYTATINNNNLPGPWTLNSNFPIQVAYGEVFLTKNRVYYVGGYNSGTPLNSVYSAPINADGTLGTWVTNTNLPGYIYYTQAIVTSSRVYLLGGMMGTMSTASVYTAPINSDGTLGSWTTGSDLPVTLGKSQAIVVKNKVYLLGGYTNSNIISSIYTADINIDGTLGTWSTAGNLPVALFEAQTYVTSSKVYLLGGKLSYGEYNYTQYTANIQTDGTLGTFNSVNINNGNEVINSWTTGTNLPGVLIRSSAIVTTGTTNRVYLMGGYNGSAVKTVYTAPINADGTLGAWTTSTGLPGVLSNSTAIVTTGTTNRVYLLGGNISGDVSTVYTAPINADGTLGAWTKGTSLPSALSNSTAIVTTGTTNRVYLLGGNSTVYTAPINADGTLGAWTTDVSLPGALSSSTAIVTTGTTNRVYLLGGDNGSIVATVYTAPINADGTLGAWTTGTSLPSALSSSTAIVTNGYNKRVYLLGGNYYGGSPVSSVYTAPINADGTLGAWTTGTSLPSGLSSSSVVVTTGTTKRVYLLGGDNGVYTSNVYTTDITNLMFIGGSGLQALATSDKLYLFSTIEGSNNNSIYYANITGGSNDYSSYYNGTILTTDPDKFRLPDYTNKELSGSYTYIKY